MVLTSYGLQQTFLGNINWNTGTFYWMLVNSTWAKSYTIAAVSRGSGYFQVNGADITSLIRLNTLFEVVGSTGNDGVYRVLSTNYTGGNTEIYVYGSMPNATADGTIYICTMSPDFGFLTPLTTNEILESTAKIRKSASTTLTRDVTNNRVYVDVADPTWTSVTPDGGASVGGVVLYNDPTGTDNDASNIVIGQWIVQNPSNPAGAPVTITLPTPLLEIY